jgi:hypothetical protein
LIAIIHPGASAGVGHGHIRIGANHAAAHILHEDLPVIPDQIGVAETEVVPPISNLPMITKQSVNGRKRSASVRKKLRDRDNGSLKNNARERKKRQDANRRSLNAASRKL